jgi:protein-tyrosine kinase
MSTIERMAELLGPIERPNSNFFAPIGKGSIPELDPIERAASESIERSEFPDAGDFAAHLVALGLADESKVKSRPVRPASRTTRTLNVDRDHLRRQSIITPDGERTPSAESFRRVKRQILANVAKSKGDAPANLVLVTSALAGEGKTFCAINLAISIALEMDRTVLLVDADVAKPSVPQALGLKAAQGLMDVVVDRRIDLAEVLWKTDIGKLTLLPAGTALQHATELLASDAMRELLQEMAERYHDRIIIFDSPPLLAASEAGVLASQMGQIVVGVEAGKTSEADLKAALGRIESSNDAGLLLNKIEGPGQGYHYGGYGKGGR